MPNRALVLDANILIRAVLGIRVRRILEEFAGGVSFFVHKLALSEAREHLATLVTRRGGDPEKAVRLLDATVGLVNLDIQQRRDFSGGLMFVLAIQAGPR